jgi:hypothetical protein
MAHKALQGFNLFTLDKFMNRCDDCLSLFFAGATAMRSLTRSRGRVTVVLFMKLTDQGVKNIKEAPQRAEQGVKAFEKMTRTTQNTQLV